MGWWFLGCFSHRKSSKKKHSRRRRHPPNNDKTEQDFSVVAVQTAAAAPTVKKKQEEQQVAEPDAHAAIPLFLEPAENEAVADSVPHLPAAPQPNVAAVIIKTDTIEASSTGIQVNLTNERQGLDAEREESPIHCNDDALEEKPHSETEPREEADKILGAHGSSSNSVEATHTSSLGTRLSGSSCGYYEISGSCLLRTDIDDDGCEPSTSLTSRSNNNDSKAATSSSFSSGTDGTLVSSQISDDSSCKEVLLVSSLQGGSEVSSSSSSAHDECTADSQESRCSVRPSGHRYQGFEEEESDTDPDYDENEQGGGSSIIAYTCLDRFDEEDEDAFSDAVSTAAFASNIREEEEVDISSSLVQSSSPPALTRKQRSVPASPVLTPVENLSQWKRVKQSERWKCAALEHLRHRASLLELQARITEEEEQQQQENQKPKHGQGSIPDTAMAAKKAANVRMAPDVVSLSHWIKP